MLRYAIVVLLFVSPLVAGCAKKVRQDRGEVAGTVRLDGELVDGGTVIFRPKRYASGYDGAGEIKNGKFHIPSKRGPSVGEMVVQFTGTRRSGKKVLSEEGIIDEYVSIFPSRYTHQETDLRQIEPGLNTFDFDLTSDPPLADEPSDDQSIDAAINAVDREQDSAPADTPKSD